jgi:hypothetical protein
MSVTELVRYNSLIIYQGWLAEEQCTEVNIRTYEGRSERRLEKAA